MVRGFDLFGGTPQIYSRGNEYIEMVLSGNSMRGSEIVRTSSNIGLRVPGLGSARMDTIVPIDVTDVMFIVVQGGVGQVPPDAALELGLSTTIDGNRAVVGDITTPGFHLIDLSNRTGKYYLSISFSRFEHRSVDTARVSNILTVNNP